MILKTAANYNDEGGYIEAWKNSDGTTEVKLIPKSGGDDGNNGILSVTISPEIETTPALYSLFPVYYDDLPEAPSLAAGLKNYQASLTGSFDPPEDPSLPAGLKNYQASLTGSFDPPEEPSLPAGLKNYQASLTGSFDSSLTYTATVTPTADWYVMGDSGFGGKGEAVTIEAYVEDGQLIIDTLVASTNTTPADESLMATITISA